MRHLAHGSTLYLRRRVDDAVRAGTRACSAAQQPRPARGNLRRVGNLAQACDCVKARMPLSLPPARQRPPHQTPSSPSPSGSAPVDLHRPSLQLPSRIDINRHRRNHCRLSLRRVSASCWANGTPIARKLHLTFRPCTRSKSVATRQTRRGVYLEDEELVELMMGARSQSNVAILPAACAAHCEKRAADGSARSAGGETRTCSVATAHLK